MFTCSLKKNIKSKGILKNTNIQDIYCNKHKERCRPYRTRDEVNEWEALVVKTTSRSIKD